MNKLEIELEAVGHIENGYPQQTEQQQRQQQKEQNPYKKIYGTILQLGFLAYGGPLAHIGMMKQRFVEQNKWVREEEFQELFSLCQSLPGPTSTQLVIAIGTLVCNSWLGGVFAFMLFSLPSAIFMLVAGLIIRSTNESLQIPHEVRQVLIGFQCSSVAIVAQAAWKLSIGAGKNNFLKSIILISAILFLCFQSTLAMYILLLIGALVNLIKSQLKNKSIEQQTNEKESYQPYQDLIQNNDLFLGYRSVALYFALLLLLIGLSQATNNLDIFVAKVFYQIGSLIVGGGHVVLPMILQEFKEKNWFTEQQYWDGFSLVSCLPGPMFNIAIYVGALIDGFITAIIAWSFLFIPAFLMIWGFLPYWKQYRTIPTIQSLLDGLSATAVGFVYSAVCLLFLSASDRVDHLKVYGYPIALSITIISLILLEKQKIGAQYVIFIGGILYLSLDSIRKQF